MVEQQGFRYFPFSSLDESHVDHLICSPAGIGANWRKPWLLGNQLRALFLETVPGQVADIRSIIQCWAPDAIVNDPALWGPFLILFETEKIPVAICSYAGGCMLPGPKIPGVGLGLPLPKNTLQRVTNALTSFAVDAFLGPTRRAANALRRQYNLPAFDGPVISLAANLPLYLLPSCPEYDYNRDDLPSSVRYVGPLQWYPPQAGEDWPAELIQKHQPVVHVTEGTLHFREPFVLRAAAEGLAKEPLIVIATTGTSRNPVTMGLPQIPNFHVRRWLPHDELLPLCDVMITTAGGGTVMAGLQHGVPMVVVPTEWDKAENAQRVAEAGAGIRIGPADCTPRTIRQAVRTILQDASYRRNALRLAAHLKRYGGASEAADHVCGLISGSEESNSIQKGVLDARPSTTQDNRQDVRFA